MESHQINLRNLEGPLEVENPYLQGTHFILNKTFISILSQALMIEKLIFTGNMTLKEESIKALIRELH